MNPSAIKPGARVVVKFGRMKQVVDVIGGVVNTPFFEGRNVTTRATLKFSAEDAEPFARPRISAEPVKNTYHLVNRAKKALNGVGLSGAALVERCLNKNAPLSVAEAWPIVREYVDVDDLTGDFHESFE